MKQHRLARVAEVVREVAGETILFELRDPRIKFTTVTRAEVSADLQHAKVYVSVMGTEKERNLTMHALRHAAGFVQSRLADRMRTRYTPAVQFILDEGLRNSVEVSRILREEQEKREAREANVATDETAEPGSSVDKEDSPTEAKG